MKRRLLSGAIQGFLVAAGVSIAAGPADVWTVKTIDPKGDARGGSPIDAAQLSFRYDSAADMLWFRVAVYGKPAPDAFGLQIAIETGAGDSAKAAWWGANK